MTRKIIKARITTDAKKLWSCESMNFWEPNYTGKLPETSGQEISLYSPAESPSPFCSAMRAWEVVPASIKKFRRVGDRSRKVCEHQIDLPEETEPRQHAAETKEVTKTAKP